MAFDDCYDSRNPLIHHLLLTEYLHDVLRFWLYFLMNKINAATTNEIKLSKADL